MPRRPAPARLVAQQPVIGVPRIRVRHHDTRRQHPPVRQPDAGGTPALHHDLVSLGIQDDPAALPLDHARHRARDRCDAAHRVMDAEFLLQMADQRIHRGDVERIAADEQRVEGQRHPQPFVPDPPRRVGRHRTVGTVPGELRQHLQQIDKPVHRTTTEVLEPEPVARLGILQEPVIARADRRATAAPPPPASPRSTDARQTGCHPASGFRNRGPSVADRHPRQNPVRRRTRGHAATAAP